MANLPQDTYEPESSNRAAARAVLMITGKDVEDLEFFYPYYRFIEAGFRVDVATADGDEFSGKHGLGLKHSRKLVDVIAEDYELLYLPGGKAPEKLKKNEEVIAMVRRFADTGKPISAICHGPQILAAADVIEGKNISGWPEIEDEIRQAGAHYVNKEFITDGQFTTARWPGDLPAHMKATLEVLAKPASHRAAA